MSATDGDSLPDRRGDAPLRLPWVFYVASVVVAILLVGAGAWVAVQSGNKKSEYTTHSPISITGNAGFTRANGVVGGKGTTSDPYLIEGWDINATSVDGIKIQDTTATFVVGWCSVHDGGGSNTGIYIGNCSNGMLAHNICSDNYIGIGLSSSSNNTLRDNSCSKGSDGILLVSSSNNAMNDNTCNSNGAWGILLDSSGHNTLSNNNCWASRFDDGILLTSSCNNTLSNNNCSSNYVYGIHLEDSNNCTLNGNTCSSNGGGIGLESSSHNSLEDNTCSNDSVGISLGTSSHGGISVSNTIINNSCRSNRGVGIEVDSSSNNAMNDNTCSANNADGIALAGSFNNKLSNNNCSLNEGEGIYLDNSGNNTLGHNKCSFNNHCGISLLGGLLTSGNVILWNQLHDNTQYGLLIEWMPGTSLPSSNAISNNTFIGNNGAIDTYSGLHVQACDNGKNNLWNGMDGHGNYWGDWTTPDTNHDGIVDVPYIIDGFWFSSAKDYYPLMTPPVPIP